MHGKLHIETKKYKKYSIEMYYSDSCDNPRSFDGLGVIASNPSSWSLGNDNLLDDFVLGKDYDDAFCALEAALLQRYFNKYEENDKITKKMLNEFVIYGFDIYEHGGVALSDPFKINWDEDRKRLNEFGSGFAGFIFARKKEVYKFFDEKTINHKNIRKVFKKEIDLLDAWVNGNVYDFKVVNNSGDIIDLGHGFFDYEEAIEYAENSIDLAIKTNTKNRNNKLKSLIKHHVPLKYRNDVLNNIKGVSFCY